MAATDPAVSSGAMPDPLRIVVLEGDQTGQELLEQALRVLDPEVLGLDLDLVRYDLSLESRRSTANEIVHEAARAMREAGYGLKAATVTPEGRDDVGSPNRILREEVDGKVIIRTGPADPGRDARSPASTTRSRSSAWRSTTPTARSSGARARRAPPDEIAYRTEKISRATCRAVAEYAFRTAREMGGRVYGGPKWTVSPVYEGMLKEELDAAAERHAEVEYQPVLIDATYAGLISGAADGPLVIPALNRDGDCLSDLVMPMFGSIAGAESVLLAFDEDFETQVAMAEAPHGTAPALEGKDIANPMAMILAAGAVLHYAAMAGVDGAARASRAIYESVLEATASRRADARPRRPRVDDRVHRRRDLAHPHEDRRLVVARDEGVSAARGNPFGHIDLRVASAEALPFYEALCPRSASRRDTTAADGTCSRPEALPPGRLLRHLGERGLRAQRDPDRVLGVRPRGGRPRDRGGRRRRGKDVSGPKEMPYGPGYYAAYFTDPAGNRSRSTTARGSRLRAAAGRRAAPPQRDGYRAGPSNRGARRLAPPRFRPTPPQLPEHMFPRPNRPDRPAHAWLDAVRHGLDLLVAFATLRDAEARRRATKPCSQQAFVAAAGHGARDGVLVAAVVARLDARHGAARRGDAHRARLGRTSISIPRSQRIRPFSGVKKCSGSRSHSRIPKSAMIPCTPVPMSSMRSMWTAIESPGSAPSTNSGPVSGSQASKSSWSSVSPGSSFWSPNAFVVSTMIRSPGSILAHGAWSAE